MRPVVLAAVATALAFAAPSVGSPAVGCQLVTDPLGDVTFPDGTRAPDTHLDLRGAAVRTGPRGLTFTVTDTALTEGRLGEWRLTFSAHGAQLFVAAGRGMWVNADDYHGTSGFTAGIQGRKAMRVTGTFDYVASEIRIDVPYAAFGAAAPRAGDALRSIVLDARETFVNGGPAPVYLTDHASARTVRLARC